MTPISITGCVKGVDANKKIVLVAVMNEDGHPTGHRAKIQYDDGEYTRAFAIDTYSPIYPQYGDIVEIEGYHTSTEVPTDPLGCTLLHVVGKKFVKVGESRQSVHVGQPMSPLAPDDANRVPPWLGEAQRIANERWGLV